MEVDQKSKVWRADGGGANGVSEVCAGEYESCGGRSTAIPFNGGKGSVGKGAYGGRYESCGGERNG